MALLGHKKSRAGCTRCKARRVKCDEGKPCRNCVRRREHCNLIDDLSREQSSSVGSYQNSGASPTTIDAITSFVHQTQQPLPSDWAQDLYLMHHYTRNTSLTYSAREELVEIWQTWIPAAATQYPPLMHGILATSALHLAHTEADDALKYLALFTSHQSIALTGFRSALPHVTAENCNALFACSMITSLSSMSILSYRKVSDNLTGSPSDSDAPRNNVTLPDIAQHFNLTRGVRAVVSSAVQMILQGPLACFLYGWEGATAEIHALPPLLHSHFLDLHTMIQESGADAETQACCEIALNKLSNIYLDVVHLDWNRRLELGIVWKWITGLPNEYCGLLIDESPPALIILVHFALLSKVYRNHWVVERWYEEVHNTVRSVLDPSWWRWLEWPEAQLNDGGPTPERWRGQTA